MSIVNIMLINFSFLALALFINCSDGGMSTDRDVSPKITPYEEGSSIQWDYQTLTKISGERHSFYPRMISLTGGEIISVYESDGGVLISRSDNDHNWTEGEIIAESEGIVRATVPEIIEIGNGEIIVAYNTRPPQDNNNEELRFGIKVIKSSDEGYSWTDPIPVYEGGYEWNRGVWEPFMMELDDELLLFFANEHPYIESKDQEISFVRSDDDGLTWSKPQTVSYREGSRDGMPVPIMLKNSSEIRIAIEDNGIAGTEFKPVIIGFSSPEELGSQIVSGDSDNRWRALTVETQLADNEYGGAPYLVQIPSGELVLSFQTTKDRNVTWNLSTMAVAIGDHEGRNFSRVTEPFRVGYAQSALWSSLYVKNDSTITAITSTDAFNEKEIREIYSIDGRILSEIIIPYGHIINENASTLTDLELHEIVSVGAYSPISTSVHSLTDSVHLHIGLKINDRQEEYKGDTIQYQFESFELMVACGLLDNDDISDGMYKITYSGGGGLASYEGLNGEWKLFEAGLEMSVFKDEDQEKEVMISIPLAELSSAGIADTIGINARLNVWDLNNFELIDETLGGNIENRPSTWSKTIILNTNDED